MPNFELHADYDRNGRLDASPAEYGRRIVDPGAILVPNLDADGRRLPASVALGSRITIDRDQPVILANDDEALRLRIVTRAAPPAGTRFVLRPFGLARIRLRFNDSRGMILPGDPAHPPDIPITLPASPGQLNLTMTTRTLVGSPIGHSTGLNTRFALDPEDESGLDVQLVGIDANGTETVHDQARFSVAPFVILDNAVPAVRSYICDLPSFEHIGGNEPAVTEFGEALRLVSVPLVTIPADVSSGDSWIQDQFQHALLQGADGWRQVLIHLPRLRNDGANGTTAGNLSRFVDSHFPSRDLGVFADLWLRDLHFKDTSDRLRELRFRLCVRLAVAMMQVDALVTLLVHNLRRLDPTWAARPPATGDDGTTTWADRRSWLPRLVLEFRRIARAAASAGNRRRQAILEVTADDVQARVNTVSSRIPMDVNLGLVSIPTDTGTIEVSSRTANKIYERVWQMHNSSNYGGNIEASPPTTDAPLGKVVIGNAIIGGTRDFIDPDVLQLLYKQRKQPVVEIDSTWLKVGHVDEFVAFVPDRRSSRSTFGIVRASSLVARRLLFEAERLYLAGLPASHSHRGGVRRFIAGTSGRLTDEGTSPVTRMFRGKVWPHFHRRPTGDEIQSVLEPPLIYQDVVHEMTGSAPGDPEPIQLNIHDMFFIPGEGPDRVYPADMTVREALFGEEDPQGNSVNTFIETSFLVPAIHRLRTAFPDARILPLPVLFDTVSSVSEWTSNRWAFETSAFTPDVVNMQVINGRLIVPRPYGPRMRLADAITVITAAIEGLDLPSSLLRRIDDRFVRRNRLTSGVYWIRKQPAITWTRRSGTFTTAYAGLETADQVIAQFRDSFPGASDADLRRLIIDANRRHFDANDNLRDGWRKLEIAETMIDLFETFCCAVFEELDVPFSWVDSWYYHVRHGEIHCGTNVLRMPSGRSSLPDVWSVPSVNQGNVINIEEGLVL